MRRGGSPPEFTTSGAYLHPEYWAKINFAPTRYSFMLVGHSEPFALLRVNLSEESSFKIAESKFTTDLTDVTDNLNSTTTLVVIGSLEIFIEREEIWFNRFSIK